MFHDPPLIKVMQLNNNTPARSLDISPEGVYKENRQLRAKIAELTKLLCDLLIENRHLTEHIKALESKPKPPFMAISINAKNKK